MSAGVAPQAGIGTGSKEEVRLRELIESEVLDTAPGVRWKDVAGLAAAKQACPTTLALVHHHIISFVTLSPWGRPAASTTGLMCCCGGCMYAYWPND